MGVFVLPSAFALIAFLMLYIWYKLNQLEEANEYESYIEMRLGEALIREGYDVRCQVKCGYYRIDLALTKYRIAIECDGEAFHSSLVQQKRDAKRSIYLRQHGWKHVLRFKGKDIVNDLDGCIRRINKKVDKIAAAR